MAFHLNLSDDYRPQPGHVLDTQLGYPKMGIGEKLALLLVAVAGYGTIGWIILRGICSLSQGGPFL